MAVLSASPVKGQIHLRNLNLLTVKPQPVPKRCHADAMMLFHHLIHLILLILLLLTFAA